MAIVTKEKAGLGYDCKVAVEQSGMDITVKAGTFTVNGVEHELLADEPFTATADATHDTTVIGYLVEEEASGDVMLLVDEILSDGEDTPYAFERGGPYKAIHRLFSMVVPAGATTLDGVDIMVVHIAPPETVEPELPPVVEREPEPEPEPTTRSVS